MLVYWVRLARIPRVCLSLPPQYLEYEYTRVSLAFSWVLGFRLRFSGLHGKHLTNQGLFPAPPKRRFLKEVFPLEKLSSIYRSQGLQMAFTRWSRLLASQSTLPTSFHQKASFLCSECVAYFQSDFFGSHALFTYLGMKGYAFTRALGWPPTDYFDKLFSESKGTNSK